MNDLPFPCNRLAWCEHRAETRSYDPAFARAAAEFYAEQARLEREARAINRGRSTLAAIRRHLKEQRA